MNDLERMRARKSAEKLYWALKELLDDTQHKDHRCGDKTCPVDVGRTLIAEIEGKIPVNLPGVSHHKEGCECGYCKTCAKP